MKKIWKVLGIVLALLIATTIVALACSYAVHLTATSNSCETITANGYVYASDDHVLLKAELYVDGTMVDSESGYTYSWNDHKVHVSWSNSASAGSHNVLIKGYRWVSSWPSGYWDNFRNVSQNVNVSACYVSCLPENTVYGEYTGLPWYNVGTPYGFGDWVSEGEGFCQYGSQNQEHRVPWSYSDKNTQVVCSAGIRIDTRVVTVSNCDGACTAGNVVSLGKVYSDLYNVGEPVWGDWVNPLNGTSYKDGIQYIASDWTETFVDARDGDTVCRVDEGRTDGEIELHEEKCSPRWTGRWVQTYERTVRGHWVTWCNLLVPMEADTNQDGRVSEKEAKAWEWSNAYKAEKCSLYCEPATWQGNLNSTNREMKDICGVVHEKGTLFGGNHYDTSCEIFDFCGTIGPEQ